MLNKAGVRVLLGALLCLAPSAIHLFPSSVSTQPNESGAFHARDGSYIDMGENSLIEFDFDASERAVEHVRGQITYEVTHAASWPFIVRTDRAVVQAVGTRFEVEHRADRTVVTVSDGKVAIKNLATGEIVYATKAQQVIVAPGEIMLPRSDMYFSQAPVQDAITEFNRRNVVQLEMPSDAEALTLTITGFFQLDNPARFAMYLDDELRRRKEKRNQVR